MTQPIAPSILNKPISPEALRAFSGEHLYYEIAMLYGVTEALQKNPEDPYLSNALLESFVIHASVVVDFFYKPQKRVDDVKAEHFVRNRKQWRNALPPMSATLKRFNRKRNKEVMHLSYQRLEVTPEEKKWGAVRLTRQLRRLVDLFLDHADPEKVHPRVFELRHRKR